jgi:hypothetical protein
MEIQMEKDLRFIFDVLPAFGTRYAGLVMGYCYLFGVTPFKIKAKKLRLLLEEMKRLFDAQSFFYQKKNYPISHAGIAEALDICIKKNFETPLDSHNYLKKIMIGISEREGKDKSRQDEKDLKKREAHLVSREAERPDPAEAKQNLDRINKLLDGIGGKKK